MEFMSLYKVVTLCVQAKCTMQGVYKAVFFEALQEILKNSLAYFP